MKPILLSEQKKILIEILKYIDNICKENNINYTLIGGSLIGAIRHDGIIPWDDDVDIGLIHDEYNKLLAAIEKDNNPIYKLLTNDNNETYFYPFAKVVDTRTIVKELNYKTIKDYGVYVDIFEYNAAPDSRINQYIHYKKIFIAKRLLGMCAIDEKSVKAKMYKRIARKLVNKIGVQKLIYLYNKLIHKYNSKEKGYVISNWPCYGYKKEFHKKEYLLKYTRHKFENIDAMIIKNYDEMLKTTFGDYMTPPPEEKRVTHHHMEVYYKSEKE